MKIYIPPQLKRLGLAFAIFILLFLLIRHLLVPKTFGEYGFYRGASLADIAEYPVLFSGQKACINCHQDIEDMKQLDVHSEIRCEACNGAGQQHTKKGDTSKIAKPSSREFCGLCHAKNAAKQKNVIFQVDLKEHNINKKYTE